MAESFAVGLGFYRRWTLFPKRSKKYQTAPVPVVLRCYETARGALQCLFMISAVIPIYNEQENLPELHRRMTTALDATGESWEMILVNDGSRDSSGQIIRQFHASDPRIKLIDLSRNFGHQPAFTAGIHHARGDCVILIDGDLQDPPEVIPEMVRKWKEGFQVVLGERQSRGDSGGARGIGFKLFY